VAGWLGSYGGEDSPDDISRGMLAGEVGSPRLLRLFEKYGLRTTWFAIHALRARLRSINPSAQVIEAPLAEVNT